MDNNYDATLAQFMNGSSAIKMPTSLDIDYAAITKPNIARVEDTITKPVVEKVVIPDGDGLTKKNYVFDLRSLDAWTNYEKASLSSLVKRGGDVGLYIITKSSGLRFFGNGISGELSSILIGIKEIIFQNRIRIYKDFNSSEEVREISSVDETNFRLNI